MSFFVYAFNIMQGWIFTSDTLLFAVLSRFVFNHCLRGAPRSLKSMFLKYSCPVHAEEIVDMFGNRRNDCVFPCSLFVVIGYETAGHRVRTD